MTFDFDFGKDTAVINGSDIEDFCQWPELSDEEDCFGSDVWIVVCAFRNRMI